MLRVTVSNTALLAGLLFLAAQTTASQNSNDKNRYISRAKFDNGMTAVVAEGDYEPRSIGSYSVRLYGDNPKWPTDDFKCGIIRERDGVIEKLLMQDINGDGTNELNVIIRCVGSGAYISADAFQYRDGTLEIAASVEGLDKTADPIKALRKVARENTLNTPTENWQLVWQDDFSGSMLNTSVWSRCKRGKANWNDTMSDAPDLLKVHNGILRLRGIAITPTNSQEKVRYNTAGINSKNKYSFKYGKVVIRARFKSATGAWPALWMLGEQMHWPANGEIDLMEHLNFDTIVYQTVHSEYTQKIDKRNTPRHGTTAKITRDKWNTYGCEWTPNKITFTINGRSTMSYPRVPEKGPLQWPFYKNFYFVLSMQVGGNWVNRQGGPTNPEHYPAWIDIDWIRVYKNRVTEHSKNQQ